MIIETSELIGENCEEEKQFLIQSKQQMQEREVEGTSNFIT